MKLCRKVISLLIAITLILSSLPITLGMTASAAEPRATDASLVLKRPVASIYVTDITRVAYAANSMKQPSGDNSVIVKATPSGMPELNTSFPEVAYAGETPVATQIAFTPGVELPSAPTISCSNTTVTLSNYSYTNGTYVWSVTGGTATVGTTLIFTVTYTYTDYNAVTGKNYTRTYNSYGVSYVDAIISPAGEYSTKRTYEDFWLGQSTKNRSYVASYVLGANTYGTLYNNGAGEGSVNFGSTGSAPGWTTEYGMMHTSDGHSASRDYNIAYHADDNRPISYVYFDRSIHSTLSDLNLRVVTANLAEASNSNERVTVSLRNYFVSYNVVNTYEGESDDSTLTNNTFAANEIGLTGYSGSIKGAGATFMQYFTGSGPSTAVGTYDYTFTNKYQTAADWNEVFIGHSHSLRIITTDKGNLRTFVEQIQGTDPTVMTTDIPEGEFKGYNPQEWYYSSGWEAFLNTYKSALSCLKKPTATQDEINTTYNAVVAAYNDLEMRTADYSVASAYYDQAVAKDKDFYTLASWAKVQNILDTYVDNYSAIYQPALDKVTADLITALESLVEATADYSEFNAHLKTINTIMSRSVANYGMPASEAYNNWSNLVQTLTKVGCIYDELEGYIVAEPLLKSEQATVNGYVLQIERAINQLSLKTANYTESAKAKTAYKAINLSQLTEDCATDLTAAYNALVALDGKDLSYQTQIDAATAVLNEKLANLSYKPADISAALQLLATANNIDRSQYEDMSAVDTAVANLESKLDLDIRYQNDINRAVSALQSAIDSLNKNIADYTVVEDAIALVTERENLIRDTYADTYGFTAETFYSNWSAVTNAVNAVVYGLDFTQQATVNGYATAITNALNSLVEKTADYSAVRTVYDEAYNIVTTGETLYTEASLDRLTQAYTSVVFNRPISQQAEVDAYIVSINEAIEALEYLPADYTQVNKQLALAQEKINLNNEFEATHNGHPYYTAETIANLETVVASVDTTLDIRYQKTVDGYVTAVSGAITALQVGPADYTQVDEALARVPSDLSIYTTLSVATLNATIKNINRTYTADKQATVDRYVTSINNAVNNLKFKAADYTSVNAAVQEANTEIASGLYTDDSVAELQAVLDSVDYTLTADKQAQVEAYATMIYDAIGNLERKPPELEELKAAISAAEAEIAKGIYTDETVNALLTPVRTAKTEIGNESPNLYDQEYVNMLTTLITDLTATLEKKPADYTSVTDAITAANEKIATGWYTDNSVELLQAEIDKVVYGLDITKQDEVNAYAQAIAEATGNLAMKLADYTMVHLAVEYAESEIAKEVYTDESVAKLREFLDSVDYTITIDRQDELQPIEESIYIAVEKLEYKKPDYTALAEAIEAARAEIEKGIYTDESVDELEDVIEEALNLVEVDDLTIEHQDMVDDMTASVIAKTQALGIKPADYTSVTDAITAANGKIATGWYTDDSVALLQAEIDKVVYDLDITEQERVILFANNIVNLTNELKLKLADYTELQKILDLLDNSSSEIYTNVYTNFNEVMSLITAYREETVSQNMNLTIDNQAQVNEMTATLQGYIDSLIPAQTERFEIIGGASVKTQGGVNYIVGLQPSLTKAKFQSTYADYENVVLEYNMTTARYLGTGSTLTVKTKDGEVIGEYVIVIYGDVDGSATINGRDAVAVSNSITGVAESLIGAAKLAANVEGARATINAKDASVIRAVAGGSMTIDQATGKGVSI